MAEKKQSFTIQITCSEEFKADMKDLAASYGKNTSDFLYPIVAEILELNREQVARYRAIMAELAQTKLVKPTAPKTNSAARSRKKKDVPPPITTATSEQTQAAESESGNNDK